MSPVDLTLSTILNSGFSKEIYCAAVTWLFWEDLCWRIGYFKTPLTPPLPLSPSNSNQHEREELSKFDISYNLQIWDSMQIFLSDLNFLKYFSNLNMWYGVYTSQIKQDPQDLMLRLIWW